jgi:hypothetical protein
MARDKGQSNEKQRDSGGKVKLKRVGGLQTRESGGRFRSPGCCWEGRGYSAHDRETKPPRCPDGGVASTHGAVTNTV